MSLNVEEIKNEFSKKRTWVVIIIGIIIASFLSNLNSNNDIPDGFSKDFYNGAVDSYYATEDILWKNNGPLSKDQQKWIQKYIFEANTQDYSAKEMRALHAYKDYQYVALTKPTDRDATLDPEWYPAYEYTRSELIKALELDLKD